MNKLKEKKFWIINTSIKSDVVLSDLGMVIKKLERKNLLDKRYFDFTIDQLRKSAESGSIFEKRRHIVVKEVIPEKALLEPEMVVEFQNVKEPLRPLRHPAFKNIEKPYFEELDFDDDTEEDEQRRLEEQYALEQADAVLQDKAPVLAVDKKYSKNEE